jgi:hypothetical protein
MRGLDRVQRREVCFHEAGHAVVFALGGVAVSRVAVAPEGAGEWRTPSGNGRTCSDLWGLCVKAELVLPRQLLRWLMSEGALCPDGSGYARVLESAEGRAIVEALGPRHPRPQRGLLSRPSLDEVRAYRNAVRARVDQLIRRLPLSLPIGWEHPWWVILMGIEHERIHLETSSVLIRQLPLHRVQASAQWPICPMARHQVAQVPANSLLAVPGGLVRLGKTDSDATYGWDNEYGRREVHLAPFQASRMLVSNAEFLDFVQAGGYIEPRMVFTSRSLVGSSKKSRFDSLLRVSARFRRFCWPPESSLTFFCWSSPLKPKRLSQARPFTSRPPRVIIS